MYVEEDADKPRFPIEEVLPGIRLHAMEQDQKASFVFCLIRTVDSEGGFGWAYRTSEAPNREELLGSLMVQVEILRRELAQEWE